MSSAFKRGLRHKNKGCMLGCGALLLGGIVLTIAAALSFFYAFNRAVYSVLSEQRKPFAPIAFTPEQSSAVFARIQDFAAALEAGQRPDELLLTADEANAALDHWARREGIELPARVAFAGDKILAELSVPLRGLYLNGSGELAIGLSNGVLQVFATTVEINGRKPPEGILELMRSHNLAGAFMEDPEVRRIVAQLEYVTVTQGKLKITPKPAKTP